MKQEVKPRADPYHAHDLLDPDAARVDWQKGRLVGSMPPLIIFHSHLWEGQRDEDGYFPLPDYYSVRRPLKDIEQDYYEAMRTQVDTVR